MVSTSGDDPLASWADQHQKKAQEAKRARNIDQRVSDATKNITRITNALERLEDSLRKLHFYTDVWTDVFGQPRPAEVDDALRKEVDVVDITDAELIEEAQENRLIEIKDTIDEYETEISDVTDSVRDTIETHVDQWQSDIRSARELDQIISGGNSEFSQVLQNMNTFLRNEIENPENSVSTLANRWDRLKDKWENQGEKHGWDSFKTQYDLSESTVEHLQQFSGQNSVHLSQFSIEELAEIKEIEDLESAIQLKIDSS